MGPLDTHDPATWRTQPLLKKQQALRETLPWTTTRCHRLLRPLKTHISALKRDIELEMAPSADGAGDGISRDSGEEKTKVKRTYSRRGRKPRISTADTEDEGAEAPIPTRAMRIPRRKVHHGEIILPTPVIRRARNQQLSSPVQQPSLADSEPADKGRRLFGAVGGQRAPSAIFTLEAEMLKLRHRISSTKFSLYDSILRALYALLVATVEPCATSTTNKSLLAMCLRKVPDYIGELEYWEHKEAEEQGTRSTLRYSDVSSRVYEAIEDLLPPDRGCPQFRIVLRAHGVKVITDAISDGLLDTGFSIMLVKLCCRTRSYLEAEKLLETIVDQPYPKPKSADSTFDESRKLEPLKGLRNFAQESGRRQFMLRQLSRLILERQLPLDWLSTKEFSSIWSSMVNGLCKSRLCDDTVSFAIEIITSLSSQAKTTVFPTKSELADVKALSQWSLLSVIAAVTTLPLLRHAAMDLPLQLSAQDTEFRISCRTRYIIQSCIYEMQRTRKMGWTATVLHLAAYFQNATQQRSKEPNILQTLDQVYNGDNRDRGQHYEAAKYLICSLAYNLGRGTLRPSHHYLNGLCDRLDRERPMPTKVRTDCAFLLAERTNDLRDLAFAESLEASTSQDHPVGLTPRRTKASSSSFTGFRWDEGISEFVTATPAPQQQRISRRSSSRLSAVGSPSALLGADNETRQGSDPEDYQSCSNEVSDDKNDGFGAAAKQQPRFKHEPKRRGCAQQCLKRLGSTGNAARPRKRRQGVSAELPDHHSAYKNDNGEHGEAEDEEEEEDHEYSASGSSSLWRAAAAACGGPENPGVVGTKKRRMTALKPHRSIRRTIGNSSNIHVDVSDDELGL